VTACKRDVSDCTLLTVLENGMARVDRQGAAAPGAARAPKGSGIAAEVPLWPTLPVERGVPKEKAARVCVHAQQLRHVWVFFCVLEVGLVRSASTSIGWVGSCKYSPGALRAMGD